ncbi:MAG TPA: hypothetical protein ENJ08_03935 [Gammaproteobacteria bacterium]|nr:hypothetical protein [Gammaproteobacteria bacterium]
MKPTLPVHLNFVQKANNGLELQGKWPLNRLKRLADAVFSDRGELEANLVFDRAGRIPFIDGKITAVLHLQCQRCMQEMELKVDNKFKLGLVLNETQAAELPDEFEPYLVESDTNYLAEILEEELLLALPLVAKHDFNCSEFVVTDNSDQSSKQSNKEEPEAEKKNAFSVLKDLL